MVQLDINRNLWEGTIEKRARKTNGNVDVFLINLQLLETSQSFKNIFLLSSFLKKQTYLEYRKFLVVASDRAHTKLPEQIKKKEHKLKHWMQPTSFHHLNNPRVLCPIDVRINMVPILSIFCLGHFYLHEVFCILQVLFSTPWLVVKAFDAVTP